MPVLGSRWPRRPISKIAPHATVTGVAPAAVPGLLQVTVDGNQIIYLSDSGKYLLAGQIIELDTNGNLTERASSALHKRMLSELPAERKIVYAAKDPKHTATVFTDVDCGYCRMLHDHIADYNEAGISIEYVLYPRSGVQSPLTLPPSASGVPKIANRHWPRPQGALRYRPRSAPNPIAAD
ncbi:DsbC family protein [Xanthomonas citri]|uniref:Thiol:disulfide interchange protein n=1 Tax=Xanthomonas citri pv. vignicola TaxID=473426 RepID=A0AB33CXH0_XANCI|nr:DsbC family protein [Xanthomonas citri]ASK94903.1 hypothetical protein XcvCFBP7111P_25980 [Xanthomonas citri pv. vignicola]